LKHRWG